jgi:hypothetical protein
MVRRADFVDGSRHQCEATKKDYEEGLDDSSKNRIRFDDCLNLVRLNDPFCAIERVMKLEMPAILTQGQARVFCKMPMRQLRCSVADLKLLDRGIETNAIFILRRYRSACWRNALPPPSRVICNRLSPNKACSPG